MYVPWQHTDTQTHTHTDSLTLTHTPSLSLSLSLSLTHTHTLAHTHTHTHTLTHTYTHYQAIVMRKELDDARAALAVSAVKVFYPSRIRFTLRIVKVHEVP